MRDLTRGIHELVATVVVSTVFGLGLILQPSRWARTPSYANLLELFPQFVWGAVYLVVAAALSAAVFTGSRRLWVTAHTLGIALYAAWLLAFVVRYLTDDGTTVVNVVSWSLYLYLMVRSSTRTPARHRAGERRGRR